MFSFFFLAFGVCCDADSGVEFRSVGLCACEGGLVCVRRSDGRGVGIEC